LKITGTFLDVISHDIVPSLFVHCMETCPRNYRSFVGGYRKDVEEEKMIISFQKQIPPVLSLFVVLTRAILTPPITVQDRRETQLR